MMDDDKIDAQSDKKLINIEETSLKISKNKIGKNKAKLSKKDNGVKKAKKPKKMPKMMRKQYTQKQLQRKLLKKVYIPEDRFFLQELFIERQVVNEKKPAKYSIPKEKLADKAVNKRIRTIAKQVKKQKARIKLLPLIACIVLIAAVCLFVVSFKNVVLTNTIRNFCENQFEAKCDIGRLDFQIFGSSFIIENFAVANKESPMTNLFSFSSLKVDFDLTQLLRARFVAEELTMEKIAVNSSRAYDGSLSPSKLKAIRNKKAAALKKKEKKEPSKLATSIKEIPQRIDQKKNEAIVNAFEKYNPKTILENSYAELELPKVSKTIEAETKVLVDKWKETPAKVNAQVMAVKESTEAMVNFDYNAIQSDPRKIKDMLETFAEAIKMIETTRVQTELMTASFEADAQKIEGFSQSLNSAILHDTNLTDEKLKGLANIKVPSTEEFLASTINFYASAILGEYYPQVVQGVDFLSDLKTKSATAQKKSKEKSESKEVSAEKKLKAAKKAKEKSRLAGRDVYFSRDRNPKFWIKKMGGSGIDVGVFASNIASNMDTTGVPCEVHFDLNKDGLKHWGNMVVDIRTNVNNPMVSFNYDCKGVSFKTKEEIPGLPQIESKANFQASANFYENFDVSLRGNGDFYNLKMQTPFFEPAYVHELYNGVLGRFDTAQLGLSIDAVEATGDLDIKINSDLDVKIANALRGEIDHQIRQIRQSIHNALEAKFNEITKPVKDKLGEFNLINKEIKSSEELLNEMENNIKKRQNSFQNRMEQTGQAIEQHFQQKVDEAERRRQEKQRQIEEELRRKNEENKKKAEEAVKDGLKNLFGRR